MDELLEYSKKIEEGKVEGAGGGVVALEFNPGQLVHAPASSPGTISPAVGNMAESNDDRSPETTTSEELHLGSKTQLHDTNTATEESSAELAVQAGQPDTDTAPENASVPSPTREADGSMTGQELDQTMDVGDAVADRGGGVGRRPVQLAPLPAATQATASQSQPLPPLRPVGLSKEHTRVAAEVAPDSAGQQPPEALLSPTKSEGAEEAGMSMQSPARRLLSEEVLKFLGIREANAIETRDAVHSSKGCGSGSRVSWVIFLLTMTIGALSLTLAFWTFYNVHSCSKRDANTGTLLCTSISYTDFYACRNYCKESAPIWFGVLSSLMGFACVLSALRIQLMWRSVGMKMLDEEVRVTLYRERVFRQGTESILGAYMRMRARKRLLRTAPAKSMGSATRGLWQAAAYSAMERKHRQQLQQGVLLAKQAFAGYFERYHTGIRGLFVLLLMQYKRALTYYKSMTDVVGPYAVVEINFGEVLEVLVQLNQMFTLSGNPFIAWLWYQWLSNDDMQYYEVRKSGVLEDNKTVLWIYAWLLAFNCTSAALITIWPNVAVRLEKRRAERQIAQDPENNVDGTEMSRTTMWRVGSDLDLLKSIARAHSVAKAASKFRKPSRMTSAQASSASETQASFIRALRAKQSERQVDEEQGKKAQQGTEDVDNDDMDIDHYDMSKMYAAPLSLPETRPHRQWRARA